MQKSKTSPSPQKGFSVPDKKNEASLVNLKEVWIIPSLVLLSFLLWPGVSTSRIDTAVWMHYLDAN